MILRKGFVALGILLSFLGLTACGGKNNQTVYQYKEASVYSDGLQIKKTVYTPGEMKLYYSGESFSDNSIRCYGADFTDLGDEFEHSFKDGVLTVDAEFAERISGLMIDDANNGIIYHLRYLDSKQFAWLAEVLWLDDGWIEEGDAEKYYSAEELKEQAQKAEAEKKETLDVFALLEGTWVSADNTENLVFTADESGEKLTAELAWYDEEKQEWVSNSMSVEAAHQSERYDGGDGLEITLVNGDHSAANMELIYDPASLTVEFGDTLYHKDSLSVTASSEDIAFDMAYLGYVGGLFDEGFDEGFPKWLKENNAELLGKYPFIAEIDREHIIGGAGHLYLIAPTDKNATLAINRIQWSEEKGDYEATDVIYRAETGEPVLLFANLDGVAYEPDTQVFITDNSGNTFEWYPSMDATSYLVPCITEDGVCHSRDITKYRHGTAANYAEWLDDGWLGPTALGLAGGEASGMTWLAEDTAWETSRKASFMLTFYPIEGTEGRVELDWKYDGEEKAEEQWSGFWTLETEMDSPSMLTLSLSRVGGESFETSDGPMYISETYPIMISQSGEELLFIKDEGKTSLPFMAKDTTACRLHAGT